MKVILTITPYCTCVGHNATFTKEIISDMMPAIGAEIEDPGLPKDTKKIKTITINYKEGKCYADLGREELATAELYNILVKALSDNGWKPND